MTEYKFDQDDFKAAADVHIEALQLQIQALETITPAVLYVNMDTTPPDQFEVSISFDASLSEGEIAILTSFINAYVYNAYADTIAIIQDVRTPGTNAGTFTENTWQERTLNTLEGDVIFATLNSNKFTLQPNLYSIHITAPACNVKSHQIRLYDHTNDLPARYGSSEFSTNGIPTNSVILTNLNISAPTEYSIQHICSNTVLNMGLGRATGFASDEIYTLVSITKL